MTALLSIGAELPSDAKMEGLCLFVCLISNNKYAPNSYQSSIYWMSVAGIVYPYSYVAFSLKTASSGWCSFHFMGKETEWSLKEFNNSQRSQNCYVAIARFEPMCSNTIVPFLQIELRVLM